MAGITAQAAPVGAPGSPAIAGALGPVDAFGHGVGLARPLALVALPVLAAVLWAAILRRRGDGGAGRRSRWLLFGTRLVVVACLVVAAAGPYTLATVERPGDPTVTLLVDRSGSMGVQPAVADDLEREIEREGVDVTRATVAAGNRSRVGDGVASNLRANGTVVLVSDGRVTGGRSLTAAADVARRLNATVSVVSTAANRTERYVTVDGPATTSPGVESRFFVSVGGVTAGGAGGPGDGSPADDAGGSRPANGSVEVVVSVDGREVDRRTVDADGGFVVNRTFESPGAHRVTARVVADDRYDRNDVFRKTVTVVPRPRVLYVARGDYRLRGFLSELYDLTVKRSVPRNLSPYYAVVLQDVAADEVGNASALQRYVLDGNGLVVAGGDSAFDEGGYARSPLGAMVPVRSGDTDDRRSRVVLAVDVSGSTEGAMRTQKALALDVLSQLGDDNAVGIVAFDDRPYAVARLRPIGGSRDELRSKVRRLRSGGKTSIAAGLRGAGQMLGEGGGTVILISDGDDRRAPAFRAARDLRADGISVTAVSVGARTDERTLRGIARESGGSFLRADETSRLRIRFGDENRQFRGGSLTVVDDGHFVTAGTRATATLPYSNEVSVKRGAQFLVATGGGDPAVSAWRYGAGRVVAVTAYGSRGGLGGLLSAPDSLLVSKSVNWAVGDPRRKAERTAIVPDARVGERTTVVYRGSDPPATNGSLSFSRVGDRRYEATIRPAEPGYDAVLGTEYAVNYRREYAGFGRSGALSSLVRATGGRTYAPDEAGAIAERAAERARDVREVRREWGWLALVAGLLLYFGEVAVRRGRQLRGKEAIP